MRGRSVNYTPTRKREGDEEGREGGKERGTEREQKRGEASDCISAIIFSMFIYIPL